MTLEEAKSLIDGGNVGTLEEAVELLGVLIEARRKSGVYIAIALYESRRLYQSARSSRGWGVWAIEQFHFSDEKKAFHRANVGEMLRTLEKRCPGKYPAFLDLGITVLEVWARLFNAGKRMAEKRKIDDPCTVIANFLKIHPDAFGWNRDKLDRRIVEFLYPEKDFSQPELALTFDAIGSALDDDELEKLTHREDFDGCRAFIMAHNGAKLCAHSMDVIVNDCDDLPAEALEDIDRALEDAHRKLRSVLRRKQERQED